MNQESKKSNRFRVLIIIPILALVYIGYMNVLPFGATTIYFVDIGSDDLVGDVRLIGPLEMMSDEKEMEGVTFRKLAEELTYFELETPRLMSATEVAVRVRFKDNFLGDERFILGARNEGESSYYWKDTYVPFYKELAEISTVVEDQAVKIYDVSKRLEGDFESIDDFLRNPPKHSVIAYNRPFEINLGLEPGEWPEIDPSIFPTMGASPIAPHYASDEGGSLMINTSLRDAHFFYSFVTNRSLQFEVTKQDMNNYDGADDLQILARLEGIRLA